MSEDQKKSYENGIKIAVAEMAMDHVYQCNESGVNTPFFNTRFDCDAMCKDEEGWADYIEVEYTGHIRVNTFRKSVEQELDVLLGDHNKDSVAMFDAEYFCETMTEWHRGTFYCILDGTPDLLKVKALMIVAYCAKD